MAADLPRIEARIAEIRAERAAAAAERGVACIDCDDSGRTDLGWCTCPAGQARWEQAERDARRFREREFRATLDTRLGIPPRFAGLGLDTVPMTDSPVVARLREWVVGHDQQRGLYLWGPFGRGKSVLLCDLLRRLVSAVGERFAFTPPAAELGRFTTGSGLLESLRPLDGGFGNQPLDIGRFQRVNYLAIDDLGAERLTAWGADRLFEVVNERHNAMRPMLVSSNLSLSDLAARWNEQAGNQSGDRIVNRLLESCDVVAFAADAPNWRTRREQS